ncbi:TD and POZ domain-containing protein 3-like [Halichondria panicea]|uniref:TD and POZ domain-containing protein 3-like n=1 Tax=Halichondria panicea TaxID=6063 RepID=UPI00312B7A6A
MATSDDYLPEADDFTKVELLSSEESKCLSSSNGNVQWEVAYKSHKLHLSLLSGATSAEVRYFVYVDGGKKESGLAVIQKGQSFDLKMVTPRHYMTTFVELCILRLNPVFKIPQESTLSAALSSTLEADEGLNDVMLYFGPGKELVQASKFMLMARSPVFKKMFETGMKEAESNEVTIDDITLAVGREMITYLYTDEAPNIDSMVEELWFAAEKYELPGLKARCENEIAKQLKIDTAAHFLLFAGRDCGDGGIKMKEHVLSFITQDKDTCSRVMKSEGWKEVKKILHLVNAVSDLYFGVTLNQQQEC